MNNFGPYDQRILSILEEKRNELRKYYNNTFQFIFFSSTFSGELEEIYRVSSLELDVVEYTVLDEFHRALEDSLKIEKNDFKNSCNKWIEKNFLISLTQQIENYTVQMDAVLSSYNKFENNGGI